MPSDVDKKRFKFHIINNIHRTHVLLIINLWNLSQGHPSLLRPTKYDFTVMLIPGLGVWVGDYASSVDNLIACDMCNQLFLFTFICIVKSNFTVLVRLNRQFAAECLMA